MTVTLNVRVVVLPAASVAVTVTVVVPTAKVEPDAFEYVIVTPLTVSVATAAEYVTTAPDECVMVTIRSGLIDVNVGGVVSRTVIVKVFVEVLP